MTKMTGGEALVRAVAAQGVDTLFAPPGVQNDPFFSALYDAAERLRVIVVGTSKARPTWRTATPPRPAGPASTVVPGPGFLNTTAALSTSYGASAPALCLSGQIPSRWIDRGAGSWTKSRTSSGSCSA